MSKPLQKELNPDVEAEFRAFLQKVIENVDDNFQDCYPSASVTNTESTMVESYALRSKPFLAHFSGVLQSYGGTHKMVSQAHHLHVCNERYITEVGKIGLKHTSIYYPCGARWQVQRQ
jgi:hypothetical protein